MAKSRTRKNSNYQLDKPRNFRVPTPPWRANTLYGLKIQKYIALAGSIACVALILLTIFWLADRNKGYRVYSLGDGVYQIDVKLSRDEAKRYIGQMRGLQIDEDNPLQSTQLPYGADRVRPFHDVRLPDGTLASGIVSYEAAAEFYLSGEDYITISTIWDLREHSGVKISKEDNLATIYLELSYAELDQARRELEENDREKYSIAELALSTKMTYLSSCPLPLPELAKYQLTLSELKEYTRRMHTVGASRIIIPFYWQYKPYVATKWPSWRIF